MYKYKILVYEKFKKKKKGEYKVWFNDQKRAFDNFSQIVREM